MGAEFKTGDLVWAKMKGFPHWPGQVTPPVDYLKAAPKKGMLSIFFFGTNNYAWIETSSLKPYAEFKDGLYKNSKSPSFKKAVAQMEQFIAKSLVGKDGKNEIANDAAIIQAATLEVNKKKSLKRPSSAKINNVSAKKQKTETAEEAVVEDGEETEPKEEIDADNEAVINGGDVKKVTKKASKKRGTGKRFVRKIVSRMRAKMAPTKKKAPTPQVLKNNKIDKTKTKTPEPIPSTWDSPPSSKKSITPPIMKVSVPKSNSNRREAYAFPEEKFMDNYFKQLSFGYNTLLSVFTHLKVQDLLNAGCVCTMWRDLANHPTLWKTVRLKNSQLHSFEGLAAALDKHGTQQLDMRKVEFTPVDEDGMYTEKWQSFSDYIIKVDTLRSIEFCNCPTNVVERLAKTNQMMESITAQSLVGPALSLDTFANLTHLTTLSLKSANGFELKGGLAPLREIKILKHLSLTSVTDLRKISLEPIGDLTELDTLELGDCTDLPLTFCSDILVKLVKLQKLRLEKGQGDCHTCDILSTVQSMPFIEQLELVNFDIKVGFDKALGACKNIKKLLLIPTYISQSATSNHLVLSGVIRLRDSLTYFLWGVTLELLRVTDLFVVAESGDEPKSVPPKGTECVPVLKPIPSPATIARDEPMTDPPQVDVVPMSNLQKLLIENLGNTRVKILKIPFHATWRQNIKESS